MADRHYDIIILRNPYTLHNPLHTEYFHFLFLLIHPFIQFKGEISFFKFTYCEITGREARLGYKQTNGL